MDARVVEVMKVGEARRPLVDGNGRCGIRAVCDRLTT